MKTENQDNSFSNAKSFLKDSLGTIKHGHKTYSVELKEKPECSNACPAGVNVKAYVNLIANKRFEEAVDVIRKNNPFPAICGRVCTRPCEEHCEQAKSGDPVAIRALKRYASDYELARRPLSIDACKQIYKEKIAIIGAGPAGLTAAVDLVRKGYAVTVFEKEGEPGGMLRYAIPAYRLPKRILKREIDWMKGLGVKIKTNSVFDDPKTLLKKGFSAVLIAQGTPKSLDLNMKGNTARNIIDPLKFLKKINSDKSVKIKGKILVIGGGSTAFDVARSAVRLNCSSVTIAYRRSKKEMPAEDEEIKEAKEEGVKIKTLAIPKKILLKDNTTIGIEFYKAKLGEPDESGRRRPIPIKGSEFVLNADYIIPAIGAKPDLKIKELTNQKDRVIVDDKANTKIKGVFAAGDVETGPSSVVEAIGRGHIAANGIDSYLKGEKLIQKDKPIPVIVDSKKCTKQIYRPKKINKKDMISTFNEIDLGLYDYQAVEEASRCFTCGPCYICETCLPNCTHKQVIANLKDETVLLKIPQEISKEVYQKEKINLTIKSNGQSIPLKLENLTAKVNEDLCIACSRCEEVCSYRAISVKIKKDSAAVAKVDHDACASCSACISACPTGAISQGYMSDERILRRIQEKSHNSNEIVGLISYWNTSSHNFGNYDSAVEIMSIRKPSPSFLIRALSRAKKGLILIGPEDKTSSHYLPWEEDMLEVINYTKSLLRLVGISPERIKYLDVNTRINPTDKIKNVSKKFKQKSMPIFLPKKQINPIGETMALLRMMWANADTLPYDDFIDLPKAKKDQNALFEGCMPLLYHVGKAHKLFDLQKSRNAVFELLKKAKISVGSIPELSCPAKGLKSLDVENADEIIDKISKKNVIAIKNTNPKQLIFTTPEAFFTFSNEKEFKKVIALPEILSSKLKNFSKLNKTIILHKSCLMQNDPFYNSIKSLLNKIPGLKIKKIKDKCGHSGFDLVDAKSKEEANKLMNKAISLGADAIVCTSPYCQSHLLLCQRQGSWQTNEIRIIDAYSLLNNSLQGGEI